MSARSLCISTLYLISCTSSSSWHSIRLPSISAKQQTEWVTCRVFKSSDTGDQFYHLLPKTLETLDSPPFFTLNNLTKILNNTIITPIQAKVAARCLVGDFIEGMTSVRIIVARARVPSVRVVEGCKCQHEVRLGWNQGSELGQ